MKVLLIFIVQVLLTAGMAGIGITADAPQGTAEQTVKGDVLLKEGDEYVIKEMSGHEVRVHVNSETKKDGASWDVNEGKADPVITVKNESDTTQKAVYTEEKTDTHEASYNSATVLISTGQKLSILVEDKDAAVNDTIGNTSFEVTAEQLKKGTMTLTFGQVKELTIEFQKP